MPGTEGGTSQDGIFHEGTAFHSFLEFDLDAGVDAGALGVAIARIRAEAAAGAPAETVQVVFGFGAALLGRVAATSVPAAFHDFAAIAGADGRTAPATQSDVFVWVHSWSPGRNFDVVRAAGVALGPLGTVARETAGWVYRDSRDLTGFIDGTENPDVAEAREVAVVGAGRVGAGGSFVLVQRWVHDLEAFGALPIDAQESVIGRTKSDSIERDPLPPTSHVARVVNEDEHGAEIEIYRRSVPYGGAAEAGLQFLAFSDDLAKFELMLARMFGTTGDGLHDRLTEFSRPATGAFYFAPPTETMDRFVGP